MRRRTKKQLDLLSPLAIVLASITFEFIGPGLYSSGHIHEVNHRLPISINLSNGTGATWIALTWLAAWLMAYVLLRGKIKARKVPTPMPPGLSTSLIAALSLFAITIAIPAIWFLIQSHPQFGQGPRSALTSGAHGRLLFASIGATTAFLLVLAAATAGKWARIGYSTDANIILAGMMIATFLIYCAVLLPMGGRERALYPIMGLVFISHYGVAPLRPWMVVLGGGAAAALIVVVLGDGDPGGIATSLFGLAHGRNFDGFYNLAAIHEVFGGQTPLWGSGMVNAILDDIGLDSGPSTRDVLMHGLFGMNDPIFGVNPTKAGELFMNGGWIAVAGGGAIAGAISAKAYNALALGGQLGPASIPVYLMIIWSIGTANFRGYMLESIASSMVMIGAALMLWMGLISARSPTRIEQQ